MNSGFHLTLMIGPVVPVPVPQEVLDALTSVSVTTNSDSGSGFQLEFTLSNRSPLQTIFLLAGGAAIPLVRVLIIITVNGKADVLMDGVMTNHEIRPDADATHSVLTVTGEDLSSLIPDPTVVSFIQGVGGICTDFAGALPANTALKGSAATNADGSIHLTEALNNQGGGLLYSGYAAGSSIDRFNATFKAFVGNTAVIGSGADGLSFNIASDIPVNETGLCDPYCAEGGVGSGFTVTIDTWDDGSLNDNLYGRLAAKKLEVAREDVEFSGGKYRVKGTDLAISFEEIARRYTADLDTLGSVPTPATFPGGAHVAEVEIDPETGTVEVLRYVAVDDCGRVINHVLLEGQLHGGILQGIGQALIEHCIYERSSGQLLTGSFMDYAMPGAHMLGEVKLFDKSVPAPGNLLGVKGVGEAGTVGAIPSVANAVIDALRPLGIHHLDFPCSPARVWTAIAKASTS